MTDGLVSYWTFDRQDITGDTVKDVWGENDGKIVGAPKIVDGQVGEALEFDGSDDYVNLTNLGNFGEQVGASTFEAWVKTDFKKRLDNPLQSARPRMQYGMGNRCQPERESGVSAC